MTEGGSFCLSPDATSTQETGPRVLGARGRNLVCGRSWPCSVHGGGWQSPGAARLGKAASPPALKSLGLVGGGGPLHELCSCKVKSRPVAGPQTRGPSLGTEPARKWRGTKDSPHAGVHHTSRNRELLALEWKGSDHIRRRSPFK